MKKGFTLYFSDPADLKKKTDLIFTYMKSAADTTAAKFDFLGIKYERTEFSFLIDVIQSNVNQQTIDKVFVVKNHKQFWLFIKDTQQGRLMLRLIDSTHFGQLHRDKIVKWVYLPKDSIRNETWLKLSDKVANGIELTKDEKRQYRKKVRILPQQTKDGVNKAILIDSLIWAHKNIHVLDDECREILELTDENMAKFDISQEINRCKKKEYQENYDKLMKKGLEAIEKEKQNQ